MAAEQERPDPHQVPPHDPDTGTAGADPATDPGRMPLAVAVLDGAGLVTHWSTGARRLFGVAREDAVGRPAVEILPVSGADDVATGPSTGQATPIGAAVPAGLETGPLDPEGRVEILFGAETTDLTSPTSGRYWTQEWSGEHGPRDVLWWAYPLLGPGGARMLLLAADCTRLAAALGEAASRPGNLSPAFAPHTDFERGDELAKGLPEILPRMSPRESGHIAGQMLRKGYPVLEISRRSRVPVTHDWGVPRRATAW